MDDNSIVFAFARVGNLASLKAFLREKSKAEIAALVSSYTDGATPLLIACKNGQFDVAHYLIVKCCADIEQVGAVAFDEETIEGASPLWCATIAGDLNLIKLLLAHKASVNSTTKTKSTPLRVACFDGHFEIVKYLIQHGADIEIANRYGHTCLMIACYRGHFEIAKFLVERGADVNRKSLKGSTALHECAEYGNLEILKWFLEHGAELYYNYCGITPLLYAAVAGHATIVEYFIEEFDCTKLETVNALELLGAAVLEKSDMIMAFNYWNRAMQLRYQDPENSPLEKPNTPSLLTSYVGVSEFITISQLNDLMLDPDEMRMQALLVRERILGLSHPDTVWIISGFIRCRSTEYFLNRNYDILIKLWMYTVDIQQKVYEPLTRNTEIVFLAFAKLFSFMMSKARGFSFLDILHVFERALKEIQTAMELSEKQGQDSNDLNQFHIIVTIAMHFVGLMCRLKPHLNKSEELELKKTVYQLVRMNPRVKNGWTVLHLACSKNSTSVERYQSLSFSSPELVDLLLEVGACPNAMDVDKNTPLHISAKNKPFSQAIFESLLNHGAHLDFYNYKKQTPLQLAQDALSLDIYPLRYISLQCLCAQAIKTHNISYKEFVSERLEVFLDAH